jgi:hypothetical protein
MNFESLAEELSKSITQGDEQKIVISSFNYQAAEEREQELSINTKQPKAEIRRQLQQQPTKET